MKSRIDVTSRLDKEQARKVLSEILNMTPNFILFSKHGRVQMKERNLTSVDVLNVLRGGKIIDAPEFENGSWRYRVETNRITVVIAFRRPNCVTIVTVWRN